MRYHYYVNPTERQVICTTTYAKKIVRAVATCAPEDTWNENVGRAIAQAKVDLKVAERRCNRACQKMNEATQAVLDAENRLVKMTDYWHDAQVEYENCRKILESFENL